MSEEGPRGSHVSTHNRKTTILSLHGDGCFDLQSVRSLPLYRSVAVSRCVPHRVELPRGARTSPSTQFDATFGVCSNHYAGSTPSDTNHQNNASSLEEKISQKISRLGYYCRMERRDLVNWAGGAHSVTQLQTCRGGDCALVWYALKRELVFCTYGFLNLY